MKNIYLLLILINASQLHAQISDFETVNLKKADSMAMACSTETLENLPKLAYKLTKDLDTDVERFRAIYMWVCKNIGNDYNMFLRNKRKRNKYKNNSIKLKKWNKKFGKILFDVLKKDKKTICTGYAYLVKELAKLANINCEIIQGYGRTSSTNLKWLTTPNHSWNAVKLNSKWYLCDPTWASGIPNAKSGKFKFNYNDGFFLTPPELFAINHFPKEKKWLLITNSNIAFNDFIDSPILYGNAYKKLKEIVSPKRLKISTSRYETINFEYKLKESNSVDNVYLLINTKSDSKKVKPKLITTAANVLKIEHNFLKQGHYDVHIYIENSLVVTYTIKVE